MSHRDFASGGYGSRRPAVEGSFYPLGAQALQSRVSELLAEAGAQPLSSARGVISPHASYAFSGRVAAEAFACVPVGAGFRRALIISPSHFVPFRGIAGPSHAAFDTALGPMPVDQAAIEALVDAGQIIIDNRAHAPDHALEVQLPFLQVTFGPMPIPLLVGFAEARQVAAVIDEHWDEETLLVASSDLSHFEPYEAARRQDVRTAEAIKAMNEGAIGPSNSCGHLAIRGALLVAAQRDLNAVRLVRMNRSAQPLPSGARMKAGEDVAPSQAISRWKSRDMCWLP
jgi:MEMO1 family protein